MNNVLLNKKVFIFDMDGTLYLGNNVFPFAVDFIKRLRKNGKRVIFYTNNASKHKSEYLKKLTRMGFEASIDEIYSSADATLKFLLEYRKGKSVYVLGTQSLAEYLSQNGICVKNENADIMLASFDTTLTYEKLTVACDLVRYGAEFLSTHPDMNCPTETGYIPDCGAICAAITAATGVKPVFFGKPYSYSATLIREICGCEFEEMCVFGDRLYTDVALGKQNGMTATLVLSGEATLDDAEKLPEYERPDFVYPSLKEVDKDMFEF